MTDTQITKVDQVKVGDFVKFVGRDKSGRFSYIGEVITIQKENKLLPASFEMLTFEGTMGFIFPRTMKDDDEIRTGDKDEFEPNELYLTTTKPTGWAKFKKNPNDFKEQKQEEAKIVPAIPKKQQVLELVQANPRKKEAALLKMALKEIGGTEATLKNYIKLALAKK